MAFNKVFPIRKKTIIQTPVFPESPFDNFKNEVPSI